jgi:hypothetical protein
MGAVYQLIMPASLVVIGFYAKIEFSGPYLYSQEPVCGWKSRGVKRTTIQG